MEVTKILKKVEQIDKLDSVIEEKDSEEDLVLLGENEEENDLEEMEELKE